MKYMMMMFGSAQGMGEVREPQWIRDMISFMQGFAQELVESGELVTAEGLTDPEQATTVSLIDGEVVIVDGPFAESKESLIGYWIVDVASEQRMHELAARVVVWSEHVELRRVADGPPEV